MHEFLDVFPDAEELVALEPEELGSKLLFLLRKHGGDKFQIHNVLGVITGDRSRNKPGYPRQHEYAVRRAIFEAWGWLENQGHLVWPDEANGPSGFRRLSRRAEAFADEADLADYTAAVKLPKTLLHPTIAERVWQSFVRREYDTAVFQALREVEIAVKDATRDSEIGVRLMRRAFGEGGPLRDAAAETGEANALAELFAGAIGAFKNPQSHRSVNLDDPAEGAEIVMLASLLLRIVDRRRALANAAP